LRDPAGMRYTDYLEKLDAAIKADYHRNGVAGLHYWRTLAYKLGLGFIPVRKPGKLPSLVHSVDELGGIDQLEVHQDALQPGSRVVVLMI